MRHVIFVAPFFLETTLEFVEAAASHPGTRLALVSQDPLEKLPTGLRRKLAGHWRVEDAFHPGQLVIAIESLVARLGPVHRLLGTLEQLQVPLARVREELSIPGMGVETALNFRDKSRMKTLLRAAGLPCARHQLLASEEDAWVFAERVGFPIVLKPPAGAGTHATISVDNAAVLDAVLTRHPPRPQQPILAEEFVRGSEHSFDAVCLDGKLVWHSLTHYLPTPLEAVRNPWIQWCVLLPREVDDPRYDDVREAAGRCLGVLGLGTGVCHLEWFRRSDGSIAISEAGARPGGAQISKLISYAHDFHFFRAWARVMIDGSFDPPQRRYAAGAAFLRGQGRGRVRLIRGLAQAQQEIGPLVVENNLPQPGQSPSSSYEGDGYVILRHRDTAVVKDALKRLISTIRVELG